MERGVRLIGNGQAPVHLYWEQLLKYIQEDKIHPLSMLTHRVLIDDMEEVYYTFEKREDQMQKVSPAQYPPGCLLISRRCLWLPKQVPRQHPELQS